LISLICGVRYEPGADAQAARSHGDDGVSECNARVLKLGQLKHIASDRHARIRRRQPRLPLHAEHPVDPVPAERAVRLDRRVRIVLLVGISHHLVTGTQPRFVRARIELLDTHGGS